MHGTIRNHDFISLNPDTTYYESINYEVPTLVVQLSIAGLHNLKALEKWNTLCGNRSRCIATT